MCPFRYTFLKRIFLLFFFKIAFPLLLQQTTQHELVQSSVCADSRFYDTECDLNCSDTCINSRCELQKTTLACKDGCVDRKQGTCCQEDCLSTCSKYERYGSICLQCSNVFNYGKKCDKRCPQNCKGRCAKLIVDCRTCASRFKGPECEKPYRPGCEECRRYGKRCIRCLFDRKDCMSPCPRNCLRCHKDTWNCSKFAQRYTVRTCRCWIMCTCSLLSHDCMRLHFIFSKIKYVFCINSYVCSINEQH